MPDNKGIKQLWGYDLIDSKARNAISSTRSSLENDFQKKTDDTLGTTSKTIPGAINEIKDSVDNLDGKFSVEQTETKYDMKYNGKTIANIGLTLTDDQIAGGDGSFNIDLTPYQTKNDDNLTTTDKTISGAINEVNTQCKDIVDKKIDNVTLSDNALTFLANNKNIKTITLPSTTGGASDDGIKTISSKVLTTVPASNIKIDDEVAVNNISINKDRRYYIEFLGSKKLCNVMMIPQSGNLIMCNIDNYFIQLLIDPEKGTGLFVNTISPDDTTPTFTDLIIYEEEIKYLDSKYLETDLTLQNSISLGRVGDIGAGSSAIGSRVIASGYSSHAEGSSTTASGDSSHAEGSGTKASGDYSHAEGDSTTASGDYSHAEGSTTTASGVNSHAEGDYTTASGTSSHVEGYGSKASSQFQHVQGKYNIEDKVHKYAHIVGNGAGDAKRSNAHTLDWQGNAWYSGKLTVGKDPTDDMDVVTKKYFDANKGSGGTTVDTSNFVKKEAGKGLSTNDLTNALKSNYDAAYTHSQAAHAPSTAQKNSDITKAEIEAKLTGDVTSHTHSQYLTEHQSLNGYATKNNPVFTGSVSLGRKEGTTVGENSFTTGEDVEASGESSHAEGWSSKASGYSSHAEGWSSKASGDYGSHAEGYNTTASGSYGSHAEGTNTTASGNYGSHAEGTNTTASGESSHAEGTNTTASSKYQHVQGKYNIEDTANKYAHIVGNGNPNTRANAHTLDWEGNAWYAGEVQGTNLPYTVSSKVLATVPSSDITLDGPVTVNNISINKDRRYYIEFLGTKKLCSLLISEEWGNCIICSIGGYTIQAFTKSTNVTLFIKKINKDDTTVDTFTDLIIYEEEVKYLDSKYLETDLVLQNSISLGRKGDIVEGSSAIGIEVEASGMSSHAEGGGTTASGDNSHAEGNNTKASGVASHAEGNATIASGEYQHVQGKYNIEDTANKYAHIVGNGNPNTRANAHTLDWEGNAWYAGKLSQEGTPTEDKDLTTKKYVDNKVSSLPQFSFNENGELVVTINGVSKTFVPKE